MKNNQKNNHGNSLQKEIIDVSFLTEESNGKKNHFIEGILSPSGIKKSQWENVIPFRLLQEKVA